MKEAFSYLTDTEIEEHLPPAACDQCRSCKFWKELEPPTWSEGCVIDGREFQLPIWDGWCLRFPPQLIRNDDNELVSMSPDTSHSEWCGEFQKQ